MPLRILIVDASRRAPAELGALLLARGHRVSVARDLRGGYDRLASEAFDVLILDVDVPRRQSTLARTLGFIGAARLVEPSASAILLTRDTAGLPPDLALLGVVGVLSKPPDFGHLRKLVEEVDRRARAARAAADTEVAGEGTPPIRDDGAGFHDGGGPGQGHGHCPEP